MFHPSNTATEAYRRGDWKEAATRARGRLKLDKTDRTAIQILARALARQGQHQGAMAQYAKLGTESLEPEDDFLLGLAFSRTGNAAVAMRLWNHALQTNPNHAEALDALTTLALQQVRPVEAAALAERLARQTGWEVRGNLILGMLHTEMNAPKAAAEALTKALDLDPSARTGLLPAASYQKMLANAALQIEQPARARQALQSLVAGSADAEAAWLLSRAHLQEENLAAANDALKLGSTYRAENPLRFEPAPYVGSAKCADCHRTIYNAQLASRHATTFHRATDLTNLPLPAQPVPDPNDPKVTYTLKRKEKGIEFETHDDGKILRALTEYAFGSDDHYMSLVGRDSEGKDRIVRLSYYVHGRQSGWDRTTGHTATPTQEDHLLGKPLDGASGLYRCLFCHVTTPRSILERSGPEAADHSIGCERCHGPGGNHLTATALKFPDRAIVNPALASGEAITTKLCGQCHSHHEAEGKLSRDDPFFLRYESTAMPWSRCYTESNGALSCVTCHDPHRNAETSAAYYEPKCLNCHAPPTASENGGRAQDSGTKHTVCPVNSKSGCISCHMPATEIPILHTSFTDHYIRVHEKGPAK
jgi:tetratricopeptide (TPR) repeat protein